MKKSFLFLTALCAISTAFAQDAAATKAASGVTMMEGTFWPSYEIEGKTYSGGTWVAQDTTPTNGSVTNGQIYYQGVTYPIANMENAAAPTAAWRPVPYTDEQILAMFGYPSLEALANDYGYTVGNPDALLAEYNAVFGTATWDALGQLNGYADYNDWMTQTYGYDPGVDQLAKDYGYTTPDPTGFLTDYGNLQDFATNQGYPAPIIAPTTPEEKAGITAAIQNGQFSSEDLGSLISSGVIAQTNDPIFTNAVAAALANKLADVPPNVMSLIAQDILTTDNLTAFNTALTAENLPGWSSSEINDGRVALLAPANQLGGAALVAQLNVAAMDLTGKNLAFINLSQVHGLQASQLTGLVSNPDGTAPLYQVTLPAMDLTGAQFSARQLYGADLTNTTGISAATVQGIGDCGLAFTKFPAGTDISGVIFSDGTVRQLAFSDLTQVTGLTPTSIAHVGAYGLALAKLPAMDLSNTAFTGQQLCAADLSNMTMSGTTIANIGNRGLTSTTLPPMDVSGIEFSGEQLYGADLTKMTGLTAASLENCSGWGFTSAKLPAMDLSALSMNGRMLYGVDLTRVTGLTAASFAGIGDRGLQYAKLPPGITRAALLAVGIDPVKLEGTIYTP